MRVVSVGLAVVAGVEQSRPRGQLCGHVDNMLAVGQQALRQRATGTVAALHRPNPVWPPRDMLEHRGIAGLVGAEPARRQHRLVVIDDLDGHRQLVGINPDEYLHPASALSS